MFLYSTNLPEEDLQYYFRQMKSLVQLDDFQESFKKDSWIISRKEKLLASMKVIKKKMKDRNIGVEQIDTNYEDIKSLAEDLVEDFLDYIEEGLKNSSFKEVMKQIKEF